MLKIRIAHEKDKKEILKILKELDLFYPSQRLKDFWLAERKGKIVGIVQLQKYKNFFFLRSLGIIKSKRKQGVATLLLKKILKKVNKNVYLYTTLSQFFQKLGFRITQAQSFLPSKRPLDCQECYPAKCVCMVKLSGDSRISSI